MSTQYVLRTKDSKFNYTPTHFQGMKNVMVFASVDFDYSEKFEFLSFFYGH